MEFTIYTSDSVGNKGNCKYAYKKEVTDAKSFQDAVVYDHVCAKYKNNCRSTSNFEESEVIVMDCDNEHSENPVDWIEMQDIENILPSVSYAITPSRNHKKGKNEKAARPRWHIYFETRVIQDAGEYKALKQKIYKRFPFFDGNALDAARFMYGNTVEAVIWHEGSMTIEEFLGQTETAGKIPAGQRNSTLSRFAGRVVKRYGATQKAYELFCTESQKCDPPLEENELKTIWQSAVKFAKKVQSQQGYIEPDKYNADFERTSLKPDDYSDIGQAKVLTREYKNELRYTDATDYLRFDGCRWVESKQQSIAAAEEFLDLQFADAGDAYNDAFDALTAFGVPAEVIKRGKSALEKSIETYMQGAYAAYLAAKRYQEFVLKRRDMRYILSALQAAKPMLYLDSTNLDKDEFLLNTPAGTYYLPNGIESVREHKAEDYITKITKVSPSEAGKQIWLDALDLFFCKDEELIGYVQKIVGLAAIGKVYVEALIIAYGEGRNGKSTFWNVISKVLGSYSGNMSADTLTVGCRRNIKPELAEAKGKRLIIAAELGEGMRLNTSVIKQLCSTDEIFAEKKYKDPFSFVPSHTLVLYTNHLPRVGVNDAGTWRRLIVIPFNARIEGKKDIKDYADYLLEHAGGAILTWIIEGAQKVIKEGYKPSIPTCVKAAIEEYKEQNNWLGHFLEERCECKAGLMEKSGVLYQQYRIYCKLTGEYTRSTADFYAALETAGFMRKKRKDGVYVLGLKLKNEDNEDFI